MPATAAPPGAEDLVSIIIKSLGLMYLTVSCQSLFTLIVSLFFLAGCPSMSYLPPTPCQPLFFSFLLSSLLSMFLFYSGVPGKPVITGFEDPVQEGGSVTLTCTSTGSKPPAQLYWYKGQEKMEGTHANTHSHTHTYICKKTQTLL